MNHPSSGEGSSYSKRAFVIYDGIHYDPLAQAKSQNGAEDEDVTILSTNGSELEEAISIAKEAREVPQNFFIRLLH